MFCLLSIGDTSFDTVESLIATVQKLEKNNKIDDESLQKEWNNLPEEKKKKLFQL